MNSINSNLQVKSSAVHSERCGRPQIIRVLVSSYLADLREIQTSGKEK